MIKANELRIGNILHFYKPVTNQPHILVVKGIYYDDQIHNAWFIKNEQYADINEKGVSPIPLTPELLERLGFEARQEPDEPLIYSILKMDLVIAKMDDGYYLYTNNTDPWHNTNVGRKIEYVHQLQNIYLDLTGEELNVKL